MKKFSKILVILISLSLLINFTLATAPAMNPSLTPIHNYTDPHQDLQDYSSDYSSALECIEDQGRYELACLKNSDDTITTQSSIANCVSQGECISDAYGTFNSWPSITPAQYQNHCENKLFVGKIEGEFPFKFKNSTSIEEMSLLELFHTDSLYFEYYQYTNLDRDKFYKQKAEHLLASTFFYEYADFSTPTDMSGISDAYGNLLNFVEAEAIEDTPYCKSTRKVTTLYGDKYIVLFSPDFGATPQGFDLSNRGPPGSSQGSPYSVKLYDDSSAHFHTIEAHLDMITNNSNHATFFANNAAGLGLTYDTPQSVSSFQEACELLDSSAFRTTGWNTLNSNGDPAYPWAVTYTINSGRNTFEMALLGDLSTAYTGGFLPYATGSLLDYSRVGFEYIDPAATDFQTPYEWIGTNYLRETCYENPIKPKINIFATDFPYFELEGVYPAGVELTFDASESEPAELFSEEVEFTESPVHNFPSIIWDSDITFSSDRVGKTYTKTIFGEGSFQQEVKFQLELDETPAHLFDPDWTYFHSFNVTVEEMIYSNIQTSLSSDQVEPGQDFTIQLSGMTFDGTDLANFFFDPGQREVPNGIFIVDTDGNFQCKETELDVTCLGTNAIYEGGLKIRGNACGCPVSEGGSGTLYSGQKTANLEDASFQYEFNFYYPSKTSCGADRICDLSLNVSDVNGLTSVKEIQLHLPGVQSCSGVYSNSIPGTNSSLFVGLINDGEQSCQCKEGYNRELDAELTALSGGNAYVCERDITIINDTTNTTWYGSPDTGQENPVSNNNAGGNSNANNNGLSKTGDERDTSGLTIFLVLMLLILAGIFGFEFYRKKKTGAFFNPFKKSPTTDSPFSEPSSQSPVEKFISDAKSAGEDPETIKQNLKKSGWPDDEIDKYLK